MKKTMIGMVICLALVSCGAQSRSGGSPQAQKGSPSLLPEGARAAVEPGSTDQGAPVPAAVIENRVRVKSGTMTIVVTDVGEADGALAKAAEKYSGYVSLLRVETSSGTVTVKIPADKFDAFAAEAAKLGTLQSKELTAEDVTDQYFDLETRVTNKRILLSRYQDYLRKAASTRELLDLEQAINNLTTEIESLEGSFRNLKDSIAYSTLVVTLEATPSFAGDLGAVGGFFLAFFKYFFLVILYSIIVLVPLTVVGGLIYWLGFGRVGLVLKFFKALGRKKA